MAGDPRAEGWRLTPRQSHLFNTEQRPLVGGEQDWLRVERSCYATISAVEGVSGNRTNFARDASILRRVRQS